MTSLQRQARALGDPTRHGIFEYLARGQEPVDVPELTEHFGLNHNAIRQHLAKLVEAGLVEETKAARTAPGRPRLVYQVRPGAESRWGAVGPYERLSRFLAEIIRTGSTAREVGHEAGRQVEVSRSFTGAVADVADAMDRQGFVPRIESRTSGIDIVLTECPFVTTALADRDTVCSLHLGFAEGLAEGTEVNVERLVARDPRKAQCRLRLREATDEATTEAELVLVGRTRTK